MFHEGYSLGFRAAEAVGLELVTHDENFRDQ